MSKQVFTCPACDHEADYAPRRDGGWFVGGFGASCPGGGECLRQIAEGVDAPSAGALLDDPARWLGVLVTGAKSTGRVAPLPTATQIHRWHDRLRDVAAYDWLIDERGLTDRVVREARVGWDGSAVVLPVYADGELVNVRRRFLAPGAKPKIVGLAGRGSQLYPSAPAERSAALLVAGELDALVAQRHGFPAVSTTTGASLPEHLLPSFAGCWVAVAYDVGEEDAARRTAALIEGVAREAWVVPLGLPDPGADVTDWFVGERRGASALRALLRHARRITA